MTRLSCTAVLLFLSCGYAMAASHDSAQIDPTPSAKAQDSKVTTQAGTTIIGGDESPIGLYITPWKNDYAKPGLVSPHHRLEEFPAPIDPDTFHRQNEYYDTITAYRDAELEKSAPQNPAPNPNH